MSQSGQGDRISLDMSQGASLVAATSKDAELSINMQHQDPYLSIYCLHSLQCNSFSEASKMSPWRQQSYC